MEDLLIVKGLYELVEREKIPTGVLESEGKHLNRKAVATVKQCVDVTVLQHVTNDTNPYEMWQKLFGLYERKNALNKTSLTRKIVRLKYRGGESIVEHRNTFMGYVNQLVTTKFPLDDAMEAILLMPTLPDSWENLVLTLITSCQEENMSIQVVKTSILNEESIRKDTGALSQSELNVAQHTDRGRCWKCRPSVRKHKHPML